MPFLLLCCCEANGFYILIAFNNISSTSQDDRQPVLLTGDSFRVFRTGKPVNI